MAITNSKLKEVGDAYHGFRLTKAVEIAELQCTLLELVHEPTGAQVMHIANEDPENLFCLSFQTLPKSSNGVAHILEHTVLCGSKKYPVKDPFFAMTRRSLNTFMNALTGADFTCYPASTQVPKDFYNLLDVYLDAVFHPNLNKLSFLQEGHRLEFAHAKDPSSPLEYKGIVYNEMKGALASPSARMTEEMSRALFPNITYGVNSGGDPKEIPSLTYEELCEFHKTYYHPSRCLFYFYGNMPLEGHLDFIQERIFKDAEPKPKLPPVPLQPRFKEPVRIKGVYPISPEESQERKCLISFGWLTCHVLEQSELLALSILEIILLDTDASPLKLALLKSGLCKQVSSYMDSDISEVPFVISLKGCEAKDADEVENIIKTTLQEVIRNGIPLEKVENAIHQLEIYRSEITGDHAPYGLSLFMRSGLLKQHGALPEIGLMIHSLFHDLRKKVTEDPSYLTGLLKKLLLDNTHFVRVVLTPDPALTSLETAQEQEALLQIKEKLNPQQTEEIVEQAARLEEFQAQQEDVDVDVLPKVTLDDVPRQSRSYSLSIENAGNMRVFHHAAFTNEIVYADLAFHLPEIQEEDLSYVRLLTILLPQLGCGGRDYANNLDFIQANTGGVGCSLTLNLQATDASCFNPSFYLRGKALHRKAPKLFHLFKDMATSVDFRDKARLKEVISKHHVGLQSSLNQSSLKYALNLSSSSIDVPSRVVNDWYGLDYYWKIGDLAANFDREADNIIVKLEELAGKILCCEDPHLILSCDSEIYEAMKRSDFYGLQDLRTHPYQPWLGNYPVKKILPQGRVISAPIAFTGMVFKTVSFIHPDSPALNIAAHLFDNVVLHSLLREKGGAYGGGAVNNSISGNFYFYAYRDPNIKKSLEAFHTAVETIMEEDFDDSDLEEAKLEMIQAMDAPTSPGGRADLAYGWWQEGKTQERRQAFRDKLLSLKADDVVQAVERHIVPGIKEGVVVTFAGRELLNKENELLVKEGKTPLLVETI